MRYRRKPDEILALQWDGADIKGARDFLRGGEEPALYQRGGTRGEDILSIPTDEGAVLCDPGDWIVRDATGKVVVCDDEVFRAVYEPIEG
jgi:hypothetical protein